MKSFRTFRSRGLRFLCTVLPCCFGVSGLSCSRKVFQAEPWNRHIDGQLPYRLP